MFLFTLVFVARVATTTVNIPVDLQVEASTTAKLEASLQALSDFYHISYDDLHKTIDCESGWNPKALNASDPEGGSRGIAQFQPSTFARFSTELGIENPDIWNPYQAIEIMAYMFSIGQANRWSCFKKISTASVSP